MEIYTIILVTIAVLLILVPVAFVWFTCIGGICIYFRDKKLLKAVDKRVAGLTCSMDADCPEGYVCVEGRCIPAN